MRDKAIGEKPIYLNRWQLWRSGACKRDRKLFKQAFGWRAEVNEANFKRAIDAGLNVGYFIAWCRMSDEMRRTLLDLLRVVKADGNYGWY